MKVLLDFQAELGGAPSTHELSLLVEQYRSYKREHRQTIPQYFTGRTFSQLVDDKLAVLGKSSGAISPKSLGGHRRWAREKVNKTILRILYLRYRVDEDLSRKHANERLIKRYRAQLGKSAIQRVTRHAKADE